MLAAGSALLGAAMARRRIRGGDPSRRQLPRRSAPGTLDYVDPALAYTVGGWALLDATCAKLMNFPDKSAPAGTG